MKKGYFFLNSSEDRAPFEEVFEKKTLILLFNSTYKSFNSSVKILVSSFSFFSVNMSEFFETCNEW